MVDLSTIADQTFLDVAAELGEAATLKVGDNGENIPCTIIPQDDVLTGAKTNVRASTIHRHPQGVNIIDLEITVNADIFATIPIPGQVVYINGIRYTVSQIDKNSKILDLQLRRADS
jgi:hypothetical protein